MDLLSEKYQKVVSEHIGIISIDGQFIKKHYDDYYTKRELEKIYDDEFYDVYYYKVHENMVKDPPFKDNGAFATSYMCIPDINDKLIQFTFNTSSIYSLELCNYEFITQEEIND
jgi:hypothetical protein